MKPTKLEQSLTIYCNGLYTVQSDLSVHLLCSSCVLFVSKSMAIRFGWSTCSERQLISCIFARNTANMTMRASPCSCLTGDAASSAGRLWKKYWCWHACCRSVPCSLPIDKIGAKCSKGPGRRSKCGTGCNWCNQKPLAANCTGPWTAVVAFDALEVLVLVLAAVEFTVDTVEFPVMKRSCFP